jgi:hypothetical protein
MYPEEDSMPKKGDTMLEEKDDEEAEGSGTQGVFTDVWRLLNSFKLAIALISLIAIASFIGVIIPQDLPLAVYSERFGKASVLIRALGFNRVFHNNWYITLLAFLALDMLLCIIRRAAWLSRSGRKGSPVWIRRFGSVVSHLSIVAILIGGVLTGKLGFRTQETVFKGESVSIPETGALLQLRQFQVETNEEGMVRQYRSEISIVEPSGDTLKGEVLVNHPFSYKGVNIFQNSYGKDPKTIENASLSILDAGTGTLIASRVVPFKETAQIDGTDLSVLVKDFAADFVMDVETGQVTNRSAEHRNPAVLAELYRSGRPVFSGWVFLGKSGMHSRKGPFTVTLNGYEPVLYSVFDIVRSRGIQLVYGGFAGAGIGFIISLILAPGRKDSRGVGRKKGKPG